MGAARISVTEFAVLGILAEGPSHGFAISKQLEASGEVGRVITVRRPLVYRALDRLVEGGYAEPTATERGEGPTRVIHRITPAGRRRLRTWLELPVEHIRDLRIEFLLKLTLLRRAQRSPLTLIERQKSILDPTMIALDDEAAGDDHVELWRQHNAAAAADYLDALERVYS